MELKQDSFLSFEEVIDLDLEMYDNIRHLSVESIGKKTLAHIRRKMNGRHTGRLYGSHRASAAGEYPAVRTGTLLRSIRFRSLGGRSVSFMSEGDAARYAPFLEHGSKYMAPRALFRKGAEDTSKLMRSTIANFLSKYMKKLGLK